MQISPRKKLRPADSLAPPVSPERPYREESLAFSSPPREGNNASKKAFESPRFGPGGSPAKPTTNVLARVGAFQAKQDASRKLPSGTIQGPSVLPSSKLYQSMLESEISVKSPEPTNDNVDIMEYLKVKFPLKPGKLDKWFEALQKLDIDTVNDVRDLTPEVWNSLDISPVLKSGLEAIRQPTDNRVRIASPALKQLSDSLVVTDSKGGRVGDSTKAWLGTPQPKSRLPEQFQEAQQQLKKKFSPAKQTPGKFLQEPLSTPPTKVSPVKRALHYEENTNSFLSDNSFLSNMDTIGEESPTKNTPFEISVSAPDTPSSSSSSSSSSASSSSAPSSDSSDSSLSPLSCPSSGTSLSSSSTHPSPSITSKATASLNPETELEREVFGESPQRFGSSKSSGGTGGSLPATKLGSSSKDPRDVSGGFFFPTKLNIGSSPTPKILKQKSKENFTPSPASTKSPKLTKSNSGKSPRSAEQTQKSLLATKKKLFSPDNAAAVLTSLKAQDPEEAKPEQDAAEEELEEGFFNVNCIKARRWNKKMQHYEYLINWEGYPDTENTWEPPASLLPNLGYMLTEFDEQARQKREKAAELRRVQELENLK